jgi:hypothetical protein
MSTCKRIGLAAACAGSGWRGLWEACTCECEASCKPAHICGDGPGNAAIRAPPSSYDECLDSYLVGQCSELEQGSLDEVLLDPTIWRSRRRCGRVSKERREVVVGDSPDIGEYNHECRESELRLILILALEDRRPLVEPVQNF